MWRIGQKALGQQEALRFRLRPQPVTRPLYAAARNCHIDPSRLGLTAAGPHPIDTSHTIRLPGGYKYADYATDWHAGFQTTTQWPLQWAYALNFKQRDDIGDARTNWELNRLAQFALMAKAYYLTGDEAHLDTLDGELKSWAVRNPFLWGISWTSPMEVAIRCINWLAAAWFLHEANAEHAVPKAVETERKLTTGAANMACYLRRHYSRGSSANNHLLVEMCAVALAGAALGRDSWLRQAIKVLDRELDRQFAPDGVNREMSLHYHAFAMEAYLLTMHAARAAGAEVPDRWTAALERMATFVAHSRVADGTYCAFGDDDEGHILWLGTPPSSPADYYRYILQFCSLILNRRYDSLDELNPTLAWMFHADAVAQVGRLPEFDTSRSHTFSEGGYTFLRRGSLTAAVDHAPLGFGSIAAHGHADALSFQLFAGAQPLLVDSGTYIYHIKRNERDAFRRTLAHNTVMLEGHEQSEITGAFMWGRRAVTELTEASACSVEATTTGPDGIAHSRRFQLGESQLQIDDVFSRPCAWTAAFIAAPGLDVEITDAHTALIGPAATLHAAAGTMRVENVEVSAAYGIKTATRAVMVSGRGSEATFHITLKTKH